MKAKWFSVFLILALLVIAIVPAAGAAPSASGGNDDPQLTPKEDNRSDPLTTKQFELNNRRLKPNSMAKPMVR